MYRAMQIYILTMLVTNINFRCLGISFLGIAITRCKTDSEKQAEAAYDLAHSRVSAFRSEFITQFYDVLSDDATEDGWAVGRALVPVLKEYRAHNPQIIEATVLTDGAGNFSGTEFWVFLSLMQLLVGMKILMHIVKEAGCGKSFLDTHFAFCMHIIAFCVSVLDVYLPSPPPLLLP